MRFGAMKRTVIVCAEACPMSTIPRRALRETPAAELRGVAMRLLAVLAFAVLAVLLARLTMGP